MKIVECQTGNIRFTIDPRIELLSVIQVLSADENNFDEYFQNCFPQYFDKINKCFGQYRSHEAIKRFKELQIQHNFYFGNSYILRYSLTPFLSRVESCEGINNVFVERELDNYLILLKSFCEESNFILFYESLLKYYQDILDFNLSQISLSSSHICIKELEKFYNQKIEPLNIVLKLVQSDWAEASHTYDNQQKQIVNICGVQSCDKYPVLLDDISLRSLIFHECSHPLVNRMIKDNDGIVKRMKPMYLKSLNNEFIKNYYPNMMEFIEELLVRASTLVMLYLNSYMDKNEYEAEIKQELAMGFEGIDLICTQLAERKEFDISFISNQSY